MIAFGIVSAKMGLIIVLRAISVVIAAPSRTSLERTVHIRRHFEYKIITIPYFKFVTYRQRRIINYSIRTTVTFFVIK